MLVVGVDSSTQACKVVVVDADTGTVVRTGRAAHPPGTEVDPEMWWQALGTAIEAAGGLSDVAAVAIGGQQHGLVALDAEGNVIRDALLWNDTRSAAAAEQMIEQFGAADLARRTGVVPVASFTATKLRWLREAEPDNAARVAAVALPHDWLTWRLRGYGLGRADLERLVTDRSDASGTGYFSPRDNTYDRELVRWCLGHDAILPRPAGPTEPIGSLRAFVDASAEVVIGPGAGDNAAAALGLNLGIAGAGISIGTSGTVFAVTDEPILDPSGDVAGFADATGNYLPLVATLNAAQVIDRWATALGVDHDEFGRIAMRAPAGSAGMVLVPYLSGERTPNLPAATGSLRGITDDNLTPGHIARAAVEGVLCGLADGLDAIRGLGVDITEVTLIGGAARNPALIDVAATVLDVTTAVAEPAEYVALGAARQAAGAVLGSLPTWPVAIRTTVDPHPGGGVLDRYRAERDRVVAQFG